MSHISVYARTQRIVVDPVSSAVVVINAGPQGPIGAPGPGLPDQYVKADGSVAMTGDLVLPGDPDSALEAATKQYVDKVYRFRGNRAATSYATGDTVITVINTDENQNAPVSVAAGVITFLVAGTYLVSASIGGASQSATSAFKAVYTGTSGRTLAVPMMPGTTWHTPLTFSATVAATNTLAFEYRNAGSAATLAITVEIVKIA